MNWPNQITGVNAVGPRQSPTPTRRAARVVQFCRWRGCGDMNVLLSVLFLLVAGTGCSGSEKHDFHGDALKIDDRYAQVIEFTALDIRVPLGRNAYVRVDGPVTNTLEHMHAVLRELRVPQKRIFSFTPAFTIPEGGYHDLFGIY